ncbi:sterol desaturase family protein [Nocardioides pantholopis]|uniref:sterol desaturase family protein n=1 Tax=Nocardioides pantholopis TaxID=2483798 RepID=UPI001F150BFA|nr:sterol desaturase family protein [Nocardioides pantholopis]
MTDLWHSLPEPLRDPVALAMPFFVVFVVVEALAAYFLEDEGPDGIAGFAGYDRRDTVASLSMGAVSVVTMALWKSAGLAVYAVLFAYVAPWQLPADAWWTWALAIVGVDFFFYWAHRVAHRVRLVWATHQAHHSSEHFNFATALRQKWNNSHELVIWAPLPLLGVPPALVFFGFSVSLVYQFFVHTERIRTLWRPIELVFNTPSHHRVHHGSDPEYLDRNYGGILIVWDRLFGSFQPELHRPTYGLTTPVGTYHVLRLQTHEYAAIARDVRATPRLRDKLGYVFGPPGWRPDPVARETPAPAGAA